MAAQLGCQSTTVHPERLRVAVAKARTSEAALEVAALGHAIHGAIGFTAEFDLQAGELGLLAGGFFVCGFHVAFLATHLPGVIAACGLPLQYSAWALAVLGLFNIIGSFGIGWAMSRWRLKSLLSLLYAPTGAATARIPSALPPTALPASMVRPVNT